VRGDIATTASTPSFAAGSPPRAWGHLARRHPERHGRRFTPTCVGTSTRPGEGRAYPEVHPHVRGDITSGALLWRFLLGSPPRAWGHLRIEQGNDWGYRFTPTCVGTSGGCGLLWHVSPVHPHVRGDIHGISKEEVCNAGSPPRAWGHLSDWWSKWRRLRFTPTCVGTSSASPQPPSPPTVHPHVRGDILFDPLVPDEWRGSPPRAWGHPKNSSWQWMCPRFTPTCVGTSER